MARAVPVPGAGHERGRLSGGKNRPLYLLRGRRRKRPKRATPAGMAPGGCGPSYTSKGQAVGRYALRTWLHRHHLQALSTRPHRPRTTIADPAAIGAENRLLDQPAPTVPDRVYVGRNRKGKIPYLPLVDGC